jgi:hypothetical protein
LDPKKSKKLKWLNPFLCCADKALNFMHFIAAGGEYLGILLGPWAVVVVVVAKLCATVKNPQKDTRNLGTTKGRSITRLAY